MFRDRFLPRNFLAYAACLPLALFLGYLLSSPLSTRSILFVGLVIGALGFPLLLRWHHPLLFFTWNAYLVVFFLPGQPTFGHVIALISFVLCLLDRAMGKQSVALQVRGVAWSLIFIALVAAVTAKLTGGIGGRALGSEVWGAKRYLGIWGSVLGYFAMVSRPIPESRRILYASVFFLSGITAAFSDLAYAGGSKFYSLFYFFPSLLAVNQAETRDTLLRLAGVGFAGQAASFFMLMRYGIRGLCDINRPWRAITFVGSVCLSLLGGFRSMMILAVLLCSIQFVFEGLLRTRFTVIAFTVILLMGTGIVTFSDKLPLSVQRSLSFLPVKVARSARIDAQGTLEWRLMMWKVVVPEIPKYLFLGKGFAYSGTDSLLTGEAIRRGIYPLIEDALVSGSYHQGVLSLIIPFGIWGVIGFVWFCWAGLKVLYRNYRSTTDELRPVNTFLLSYFIARLIFYVFFYGQFELDFFHFVGAVGLSVALNGGVETRSQAAPEPEIPSPVVAATT